MSFCSIFFLVHFSCTSLYYEQEEKIKQKLIGRILQIVGIRTKIQGGRRVKMVKADGRPF